MKIDAFLNLLREHPEKSVVFEYQKDDFVPKGYHITEVKKVHTDSVDCGGNPYEALHTSIQLWSPEIPKDFTYMKAGKMRKIIDRVDSMKPILRDTDLYFEYGNQKVPTSNFAVKDYEIEGQELIFKLFVEPTACRPLQLKQLKSVASDCCNSTTVCC